MICRDVGPHVHRKTGTLEHAGNLGTRNILFLAVGRAGQPGDIDADSAHGYIAAKRFAPEIILAEKKLLVFRRAANRHTDVSIAEDWSIDYLR